MREIWLRVNGEFHCDLQAYITPYRTFECVSPLVSSMVKKCLQKRCYAASEVKRETSLLLFRIQKWSDDFHPFERTTSRNVVTYGTLIDHIFDDMCSNYHF